MNLHFRTFRLQSPHAPPSSGDTFCSGRAWPPTRIGLLSAVLRTSYIASSLVSRIRPNRVCVAARNWAAVLRTIHSLPVALHPVSPRRSYFQLLAGSSTREGLPPSCARSLSSALTPGFIPVPRPPIKQPLQRFLRNQQSNHPLIHQFNRRPPRHPRLPTPLHYLHYLLLNRYPKLPIHPLIHQSTHPLWKIASALHLNAK